MDLSTIVKGHRKKMMELCVVSLGMVVAVLMSCQLVSAADSEKQSSANEKCEYEIDLTKNMVKAVCQGQTMGVSVYADTANVMTTASGGEEPRATQRQTSTRSFGEPPTQYDNRDFWKPPATGANNVTSLLRDMRQSLGARSAAIANISSMLNRGDADLKQDLDNLRRLVNNQATFREGVIATLQNQYNFMRTAILAQNAELTKVLGLLETLATMTSDSVQAATRQTAQLSGQLAYVNRTMLAMRKMVATQMDKKNGKRRPPSKKDGGQKCTRTVSAFGRGEELVVPWENGVVMHDAAEDSERLWIMTGGKSGSDQLLEYDSEIDIQYQLVARQFSLPFYCDGTGHVVYRNALYCQKAGTRLIVKYTLKRMNIKAETELPSAGVGNTYPYQFGMNSDIDFAVDELGLWVVYSTTDSAGKIVISKLNARSLTVEKTWMTSYPKQLVGNSFMICGVLYATNSFQETPTFVRYVYDTNTQTESIHEPGQLVFQNTVSFNASSLAKSVMLDYDPRTEKLYSWSNSRIQSFPVFFKSESMAP